MEFHHFGQAGLELLTLGDPSTSASRSAGSSWDYQHPWLIFVILVETGFHHVGQAGLELLTSGDPTSASRSAGITGVAPHTQPKYSNCQVFSVSFLFGKSLIFL
uniref:Uncharacterized protein n=1 Tax=Papio anubis TaxID=9555 RepID=A0A8I5N879_PAPAN